MTRDRFLKSCAVLTALPLASCADTEDPLAPVPRALSDRPEAADLPKTEAEWRQLLSPDEFAVLFEGWTEPPGSSPLTHERRAGTYLCAACFAPLFGSAAKYDSPTGWPTFREPLSDRTLGFQPDNVLPEVRTEYHCRRCGGHQGHVFDDGPPPTGERYCNNGRALRFVAAAEPLPMVRT